MSSVLIITGAEKDTLLGVGQDWVWFDADKEYGGKEDEVLLTHHTKRQPGKLLIQTLSCHEPFE